MAIYRLLQNVAFDPEHVAVLTSVFEDVCDDLHLAKRDDPLRDIVAKAIIECARKGELEPIRLRECAHEAIRA